MSRLPLQIAVYALSGPGARQADYLVRRLPQGELFLPNRLASQWPGARGFDRLAAALADNFPRYQGHVLFCAAGIVVRALASLVANKARDPAVVVVDQAGRFAVSLLSGHLGGANDLARRVAEILGGQAVITTATDGADLPSLELVASQEGCRVENLKALAGLSRALLEGGRVDIFDPLDWLWPALQPWQGCFNRRGPEPDQDSPGPPLAWVGWRELSPPPHWLVIRPPCLAVGVGCNRGTSAGEMARLLDQTFADASLSRANLKCLASIENKRDETGILELARELKTECVFFPAERLRAVTVPNPSPLVEEHMGVPSVCEAAAMAAAESTCLLVPKKKTRNATLAVALAGSA